jgi:hypothetical protein
MAYQKLQVSRALVVIPSDTVDIPFPGALMISSTTTGAPTGAQVVDVLESGTNSTDGTTLTDAAKNFITAGVQVGDTVEDTTSGNLATITAVGVTTLTLDTDIFPATGRAYSLGSFIRLGVRPGDIIYSGTTIAATVVNVVSGTLLTTTVAVPNATAYKLYKAGANEGCVLYVGTGGNLDLITAGGDTVLYTGVPTGMFMPVQVKRVKATLTGASTIVAQW